MALFRRRRQTAPVLHAAAPELSDEQLLTLVTDKLAAIIGAEGKWTLVRREDGDTDTIFHTMLSEQIASEVTATVVEGRDALRGAPGTEPSALTWTPAPIAVWADASGNEAAAEPAETPKARSAEQALEQLAR